MQNFCDNPRILVQWRNQMTDKMIQIFLDVIEGEVQILYVNVR